MSVPEKNQNVVIVLLRSKDQCKNDHIPNLLLSHYQAGVKGLLWLLSCVCQVPGQSEIFN